ncbi:HpcH/HpaI aldolase family protein [Subtercola lobariae]|uniref:Aldolase n=1 Tax=Subtercola lobariae TaxID=1588641 RepID=A0A917AYM8_9MICO|nr:aldolase/citrate lyase family protein [Subtercola lobariae]GGF10305.1 aldolase [Subtercola lobariae]
MAIYPNTTLRKILGGELTLGFGVTALRASVAVPLAHAAGYDWLVIDAEHGSISLDDIGLISLAALPLGITPIVRINFSALDEASRALDNGAQGIIIPSVESKEQAEAIVSSLRYPPLGRRNWGGTAPQFGYRPPPLAEAVRQTEAETLVIAMIESSEGVRNVHDIASVEGIDALFVGAADLSLNLGVPGGFGAPALVAAIDSVIAACDQAHKVFGFGGIYDRTWAATYRERGARLVAAGADHGFVLAGATERASFLRSLSTP